MEEKKEEQKKLSYEQLENYAAQLSQQVQALYTQLQESKLENVFKRLDYLFKIIENATEFDDEFVNKTVEEVKSIMTLPSPEEEAEAEKPKKD